MEEALPASLYCINIQKHNIWSFPRPDIALKRKILIFDWLSHLKRLLPVDLSTWIFDYSGYFCVYIHTTFMIFYVNQGDFMPISWD
jgi:hypothetical protein